MRHGSSQVVQQVKDPTLLQQSGIGDILETFTLRVHETLIFIRDHLTPMTNVQDSSSLKLFTITF